MKYEENELNRRLRLRLMFGFGLFSINLILSLVHYKNAILNTS